MKRNQKKSRLSYAKLFYYVAIVLFLAAAAFAGTIAWQRHRQTPPATSTKSTSSDSSKIDYTPAKPSDNTASDKNKESDNPTPTLNTQPAADFSVTITGANVDNSAKVLRVTSLVNGTKSGTCTLMLSKSGQATITAQSQVILSVNSYTCPVFSIPLSRFPVGGAWNVGLEVVSGDKKVSTQWQGGAIIITK